MRRYIPGLHSGQQTVESKLDGLFLVCVDRAFYRWHPQKPFLALRLVVLEPKLFEARSFSGRLYCTERALWKLDWFLRDFEYDRELLSRDQIDEEALLGLRGSSALHTPLWMGVLIRILMPSLPLSSGENARVNRLAKLTRMAMQNDLKLFTD